LVVEPGRVGSVKGCSEVGAALLLEGSAELEGAALEEGAGLEEEEVGLSEEEDDGRLGVVASGVVASIGTLYKVKAYNVSILFSSHFSHLVPPTHSGT
jgi:hypothetical protein